jgi:hypothetical protein
MADKPTMAQFMTNVPRSTSGNTHWAEQYGNELKGVVKRYAARAPRSVQTHLGPSELGEECDRQVVAKMAASKHTNNVSDPWPSVMGTAGHAYVEGAFQWDNEDQGYARWLTECKVTPDPSEGWYPGREITGNEHPGTADLYDAYNQTLVDHKFLGASSMTKLKAKGPKRVYYVQLLLYRRGYLNLGLPVKRIALVAWPRTSSSLDDMYVWEHTPTAEDEALVDEVLDRTTARQYLAEQVRAKKLQVMDITPTPSDDSCFYCSLYRPQSAYDNSYGCPGTLLKKLALLPLIVFHPVD